MDQLACSLGQEGELLAVLCQPSNILGHLPIPTGLKFWAIDSGAYHSVAGDNYSRVRAAAFMGLQYVKQAMQVWDCVPCHGHQFRCAELVRSVASTVWDSDALQHKKSVQETQQVAPDKRKHTRSIPPMKEPCYLAELSPSLWESGILDLTPEDVLGEGVPVCEQVG